MLAVGKNQQREFAKRADFRKRASDRSFANDELISQKYLLGAANKSIVRGLRN